MHEVIWDLRIEATGADGEATGTGPRVLAGAYIVEMTTGADVVQSEVSVRMDPRINLGRRDLMVRHQSMMESYRLSHVVDAAEDALGEMDDHLDEVHELLEDRAPDGLAAAVAALRETLEVLGDDLDDASDGASAWRGIEGSGSMPTSDALFQIDRSWEDLPGVIDRINGVMEDFNRVMGQVYAPAAMPEGPTSITVPSRGG
jgi:hypothetical protein